MAPHSSTVARKIPWMEEPGRLQSMGSLRVSHDGAISLSLSTFMHWRRKWQPTSVFLPGESHGRVSLVSCSPWGRTELDTTEATQQQQHTQQRASRVVLVVKKLACLCRRYKRCGYIPWSGRCPGEGNGYPLQYSCLKNPPDRGAWQATVHRVAKIRHT